MSRPFQVQYREAAVDIGEYVFLSLCVFVCFFLKYTCPRASACVSSYIPSRGRSCATCTQGSYAEAADNVTGNANYAYARQTNVARNCVRDATWAPGNNELSDASNKSNKPHRQVPKTL